MPKFRKRPVVIEAEQWFPSKHVEGVYFEGDSSVAMSSGKYLLKTLENPDGFEVTSGDWIITGIKGEKYACKPDIFEATYEPAAEGEK